MANRKYTLTLADFDINSVSGTDAGTAAAGTVVVDIAESAGKTDVVVSLRALADLIAADQEALN